MIKFILIQLRFSDCPVHRFTLGTLISIEIQYFNKITKSFISIVYISYRFRIYLCMHIKVCLKIIFVLA